MVSRDFTRGVRTSFYTMLFGMGALFWVMTETGQFRMSVEVYGEKTVALPAALWAICMMLTAAVYLLALFINGAHPWTPYVRILCGFFMATYFSLFVTSAWPAAGGDLMVVASGVMMLKASALTYIDASELLRQWGRRHDRHRLR